MRTITLMTAMIAATPILAEDAALVLGNARYTTIDRIVGADDVTDGATALGRVGFDVQVATNAGAADMREAVQAFAETANNADRLLVALSGQFATDGDRTWFLPVDATAPTLFTLDGAVSLQSLLQLMVAPQGQSILALGFDSREDDPFDRLLREGIGDFTIPQGVTVVLGDPDDISDFLVDLAKPGADIASLVASNRGLRGQGFLPENLILVPPSAQVATDTPAEVPAIDPAAEQALWDGARALDTVAAYRNYVTRYPDGRFVTEAEKLITEISTEPNRPARLAEEALGLTRDQRRDVQRDLTLLNFDPRGIDGIFGSGTRSAVQNWQQQNGYSQTTYLTTEQINQLDAQAARRSAELEAEAERARQERLRLDRAFWDETGAKGDEPGLRAYLEKYPQGTYASQANDLLATIEQEKRAAAAAEDTAAWEAALETDTVAAYQGYLQAFPQGALIEEARARLNALQAPEQAARAGEDRLEAALGLNAITLRLIEARLAQIGLEPGPVDGVFDDATRGAIRNFQQDRSIDVTGYLNEQTVAQILADGLRTLGDQ